jgi:pyruvate/2-oxoglutarate dehydrogenase complex dihydrolipoamide dehydrogenase (E3) component
MSEKYDIAVIGSGSGGSEAALLAAEKGFRAILIEKDAFGGTRFHRGCYAVRALHASSRVYRQILNSRKFGMETDLLTSSLMDWMKAQRAASARLGEDLRTGLQQLNVRIAAGTGSLVGEHQVQITDSLGRREDIDAEYIILATGSRPDYASSQGSRFFNSDDLIARVYPPSHLFIIGGGYVGCEFASIYRALGCRVSLAEQQERLLPGWDPNVGERVAAELSANGVEVSLGRKVEVEKVPLEDGYPILTQSDGEEISPDLVLVATGRRPNVESIGLDLLGIAAHPHVKVDAQLRTSQRHIFAIGDVNGLNMLDSSASAQARIAVEAIRGGDALFSSRWVPRYLDTDPPVAAVGWMETEANDAGFEVDAKSETVKLVTSEDRTVADPSYTQVKLIVERHTKKIRGCVIIGHQAAEVINLVALAIQSDVTTGDLERLFLVHPSASVALQRCAAKFR